MTLSKEAAQKRWKFDDTAGLLANILEDLRYFIPEGKGKPAIIPYHWAKGSCNLAVVLGENASGKSFLRRCAHSICQHLGIEFLGISMELRYSGGIERAFIFGDENTDATGVISLRTVLTGISTCRSREKPHVMCWDEPDLGLSDNAAAGVGLAIAEFIRRPGEHTKAIIVMTHSRALVEQLLPLDPHYVYLGCDPDKAPATLADWLKQPIVPADLEALREKMLVRFRAINKMLHGKD